MQITWLLRTVPTSWAKFLKEKWTQGWCGTTQYSLTFYQMKSIHLYARGIEPCSKAEFQEPHWTDWHSVYERREGVNNPFTASNFNCQKLAFVGFKKSRLLLQLEITPSPLECREAGKCCNSYSRRKQAWVRASRINLSLQFGGPRSSDRTALIESFQKTIRRNLRNCGALAWWRNGHRGNFPTPS